MAHFASVVPIEQTGSTAAQLITEKLAAVGFGVLTTIDVQATFKAKLDIDRPGYTILGACHPQLAKRALEIDTKVGVLMPCSVVIEETESGSLVYVPSATVQLEAVNKPEMTALAAEVDELMRTFAQSL